MTSQRTAPGPRPSGPGAPGRYGPVHSWDEFTRLREVIVGDVRAARIPSVADPSAWLNLHPELRRSELDAVGDPRLPARVHEETDEDLSVLASTLREAGVTVRRPQPVDHAAEFGAPGWRSRGMYSYCPRDLALILGGTIVETPSPTRARYFESLALHPLFRDYLRAGARWLSAPRPALADALYDVGPDGHVRLTEAEVAFEAANVLRIGRDLIYQVSTSGNELGLTWLAGLLPLLGDLRIHPLRGVYGFTHIDSTIAVLRPGLVLLNPERITPGTIPRCFRGWDVLWCPPPPDDRPAGNPLSSPWIAMNLLMVDVDLALVDAGHPALARLLEGAGITVVPLRLRHARTLGGGFHCVTLDVRRDGELTDYSA